MDAPESQCKSRLTNLPAEIRAQIYTHLFEDWTLCISLARNPLPHEGEEQAGDAVPRESRLDVRAIGFPGAAFHVCRGVYGDLMAMKPFPLGTLQVKGDMSVASELRRRLGKLLEALGETICWAGATRVLVNQEGVHGLDIGLIKQRMGRLQVVEVILRDVDVNVKYASGWVWKALGRKAEVVRSVDGEKGWESGEFAFGYLHSFLRSEWPPIVGIRARKPTKLVARQHVGVWSEQRRVARLDAVHDIAKRRILSVTRIEAAPGWRELRGHARAPIQSTPVPFFGVIWSAVGVQTKPNSPTTTLAV